jgi:hypothetical protein
VTQLDLFAKKTATAPVSVIPEPAEVRRRMENTLAELINADRMPWTENQLGVWRIIWPQMMRWLPDAEHAELQRRFDEQVARLARG